MTSCYDGIMENPRKYVKDFSFLSLLVSNLLVIFLAVFENWDTATVLWVYWIQSIIIGFFQFFRILSLKQFSTEKFTINNQPVQPTQATKVTTALFFAFHYGFFHLIYAIFLFTLFTKQLLDRMYLFTGGGIFFINHFFSYRHNKRLDEQKVQRIGTLMFAPYKRIIPMHIIIVLGGILGQGALIVFLLLKTATDLVLHTMKHHRGVNIFR